MYVGGTGNTGLRKPEDMKYLSLTRCGVSGDVTLDGKTEKAAGEGWFDHQWGDTWTTQTAGWDWWGVQLADGTDLLFFRQRDLATGKVFFPLATMMDKAGKLTVTKKIVFAEDRTNLWTSLTTGVVYPLGWTITFPDQKLTLKISADVADQEMPVISGGGAIWEGSCTVTAQRDGEPAVPGTAYMELVGYNSPAVRKLFAAPTH
jgi:predicted secreted hydrolase